MSKNTKIDHQGTGLDEEYIDRNSKEEQKLMEHKAREEKMSAINNSISSKKKEIKELQDEIDAM